MTNAELAALAQRMKSGDETAFSELYSEMWKTLCYIASKQLDSKEEAMDAVQDTLLVVHQDIHKLKDNMACSAWINRILYSKCAAIVGTKQRKPTVSMDEITEAQFADQMNLVPEEWILSQEACDRIGQMVSDLPQEQRAAILLYYYNGLSTKEIAEVMNSSTNAIMIKMSRARASIKTKIQQLMEKGDYLYSMTTASIFTRFLIEDANRVCPPEMKDRLWEQIQLGLKASAVTATAATSGSKFMSSTASKIGVGVVSVVTLSGVIFGGIYLKNNSNSSLPMAVPSIAATAEIAPSSETTIAETTFEHGTLAWMIGQTDATLLQSFAASGQTNKNPEFKSMVRAHQIKLGEYYFDMGDENSMYVLYTLNKEDKLLTICEFYNSTRKEWSVKSGIYDSSYVLPQSEDIKTWFQAH